MSSEARETMEKTLWLYRIITETSLMEVSVGGSRLRDTCSALIALASARHRDNSIVSERLTIMANL